MLNAPIKTKEKPSIVSKKVLKTHHKNGTESYLLMEKIKTLEHKQSQKNIDIDMEVNCLKKKMEAVQRVKEKITLSKERRILLKSQGYTIRVCKGEKEDDIILRRDSLQVDAGNWATLLANPPDFSPLGESSGLEDVDKSHEESSSSSESRMRSYSLSSAVDSRPTQVSRYRVIEPPLRPGSRRGFSSLSATPTPKTATVDQEIRQEFNEDFSMPSERAPTRWDVIRNRPLSGRSLFVETVIAARDSNHIANSRNLARERMESRRRRRFKSLSSRRTMSAPVIKMRSAMCVGKEQKEEDQRASNGKGVHWTSEAESFELNDQKNSMNLKLDKMGSLIEGKQGTSENIRPTSESNLINESKLGGLSMDQQDVLCLSSLTFSASKSEKKNVSTHDNSESLVDEHEIKEPKAEEDEEKDDASSHGQSLRNCNQIPNERSKNTNNCNELFPIQTSKMSSFEVRADVLNAVPLNEQEVVLSEDADRNELCLKNKHEKCVCAVDSDTAVRETSSKTYLSLPDKTSRMSIRRHSSDDCEINNVRFHGNQARNQSDPQGKGHVTLQIPRSSMLNRRMSHPPRLASFQGDDKRKRKTLKNEDEVVYAYDARPDKSLAKGYRAMQMTVGGRQVKISMPAFSKQSGTIMADRAKMSTKFGSLRGKN